MPNNQKWDGKTERRSNATDHDHIIRMLATQETMMEQFKSFNTAFVTHTLEDERKFDKVNKNIYMFNGGLIVINAVIGIFLVIRFH